MAPTSCQFDPLSKETKVNCGLSTPDSLGSYFCLVDRGAGGPAWWGISSQPSGFSTSDSSAIGAGNAPHAPSRLRIRRQIYLPMAQGAKDPRFSASFPNNSSLKAFLFSVLWRWQGKIPAAHQNFDPFPKLLRIL